MEDKKIRVAICGGGIGGLSLAVLLSRHTNIELTIFEAAAEFKEIGAGVLIWSRTWDIFKAMGLESEFAAIAQGASGDQKDVFDLRASDQPEEGKAFMRVNVPFECHRFHRAQFQNLLVKNLPPGLSTQFGKRLVSYSRSESTDGPIVLRFSDGTTASCDTLIGADGIKSVIRGQMYGQDATDKAYQQYVHPSWTGTVAYRGLIPSKSIPLSANGTPHEITTTVNPRIYCGKNKHLVAYPICQGELVNLVACVSEPEKKGETYPREWVVPVSPKELLDSFSGWEPQVQELLSCIKEPSCWAIHHIEPLPFYHQDGVVLLGDAAHAMSPHQGAGAGQAIEDAFILANLLSGATHSDLHVRLEAYQKVRIPFAGMVQRESYNTGKMYQFNHEYCRDYEKLGPAIEHQWDWMGATSVHDEVRKANAALST